MVTCKYCGQEIKTFFSEDNKEVHNYCSFCDMYFSSKELSKDRKRKVVIPECTVSHMYLETKEVLQLDTISLLHLLKDIREFWFNNKQLLEQLKQQNEPDCVEIYKELKKEFILLTKKKFVVENVILERLGYIPEKITNEFLSEILRQVEVNEKYKMFIYIK